MNLIKTQREIELMREGGRITAAILDSLAGAAQPGVTTKALECLARSLLQKYGAESAFEGFQKYPAVLCASVNEVAVHGLPSDYFLKEGDVLGIDFGVRWKGYCTDSAITVGIGQISSEAQRLIVVTKEALYQGIAQARSGAHIGDISEAIQKYVEKNGFHIVRDLVGHGVGKELHEPPQIPNFGKAGEGLELKEGMIIAIEPIVGMGTGKIKLCVDGFGYKTEDASLAAHFEHTVLISKNGPELLTEL